jgi:hypothetical protein
MKLVLGIDTLMSSMSLFTGESLPNASLPLYYPVRTGGLFASMCMENSLDPTLLKGWIIICDRNNNLRVAKEMLVKDVADTAMVLTND